MIRRNKGLTLIEIMVALAVSAAVIGAVYRTFLDQRKNYAVQEEVVDMQQNMRIAIQRMIGEIRMAGLGNVSMVMGTSGLTLGGRTFNNILNPDFPCNGSLSIISGNEIVASLSSDANVGASQITVSSVAGLNIGDKKYISIAGVESHQIDSIVGSTLNLHEKLIYNHKANLIDPSTGLPMIDPSTGLPIPTPVFGIKAVNYRIVSWHDRWRLVRAENEKICSGQEEDIGDFIQADNIEDLQFRYFDADDPPNETADPQKIRMVRVALRATTENGDPGPNGGGYRKREVTSNVHLQNMGLE